MSPRLAAGRRPWWICVATEPWVLSYDWMPWLYVPAYIVFLVAAASVAAGASRDLWILTLGGWFLIHGHACFLFFVPVILAAAVAVAVWQHGPRALLKAFLRARVWVPVAVISAVFALPVVAGLVLRWPTTPGPTSPASWFRPNGPGCGPACRTRPGPS